MSLGSYYVLLLDLLFTMDDGVHVQTIKTTSLANSSADCYFDFPMDYITHSQANKSHHAIDLPAELHVFNGTSVLSCLWGTFAPNAIVDIEKDVDLSRTFSPPCLGVWMK